MRALGFCVSVEHAKYMAEVFNNAGIPSTIVSGDTPEPDREAALRLLRDGELNCIFAVDVFNEGLDLPEVDTILMLRPTQSSTIFLQQLGRGLRRAKRKAVLRAEVKGLKTAVIEGSPSSHPGPRSCWTGCPSRSSSTACINCGVPDDN